jgi:hypothetical protein
MAVASSVAAKYREWDGYYADGWRPWHDAIAACLDSAPFRLASHKVEIDTVSGGGRSDFDEYLTPYVIITLDAGLSFKITPRDGAKGAYVGRWILDLDQELDPGDWWAVAIGQPLIDRVERQTSAYIAAGN